MKKIFFYASLLALATSCTDEFETLNVQNEKAQGIMFEAVETVDSRMQWDEEGNSYVPFWYAERDRINIYGLNVQANTGDAIITPTEDPTELYWKDLASASVAEYKATQSKKNGVFTAVTDAKTLHFDGDLTARFVALYPKTVTAAYEGGKIVLGGLPDLASQEQKTLKGDNEDMLMYDLATASKENAYDAVGEKVQLSFQRPLSAIVYKTANANEYTALDEDGNSVFGKLLSITYKGLGGNTDENDDVEIPASLITFNTDDSFKVDTLSKAITYVEGENEDASSEIVLNIDQNWNDDAMAMMVVNNVDRSKFRKDEVAENIEVLFSFENIDIKSKIETVSVDFDGFLEFPALDINDYDYLVTKGTSGSARTLIVNKGTFSGIFNEDEDAVVWTDIHTTDDEVAPTDFTEIIIGENVVLDEEEFALLEQFTAVEKLTLKGNTALKEGYLDALTSLDYINMPKVTSIESKSFYLNNGAPIFKTVILPAYDFEDLLVNPEILNKETLQVLDMSGVTIMNAGFPARGLTLEGYSLLEEVTVQDGIQIGSNAFKGCERLNKINGVVDIQGTAAFMGVGTEADYELKEINIMNTVIPANTFEGCVNLSKILLDGEQVVPTEVGTQAFKSCAALVNMDLSNVEKLGQEAFMNCSSLIGMEKAINGKDVLTVGAEKISKSAFDGCSSLTYVYFVNATTFEDLILNAATSLAEVKFGTPFTPATNATAAAFPAQANNVKLFVNPDQDVASLENNVLKWAKNATVTITVQFASITKENKF